MRCSELRALLWALCEGTAERASRVEAEGHLAGCEACRREKAAVERTLAALGSLSEIEPSPDFQAAVWRRIDAWEASRGGLLVGVVAAFVRRNRRLLATSLAAFAVALVGGLYALQSLVGPQTQVARTGRATGYEGVALDAVRPVAGAQGDAEPDYVLREIPYPVPLAGLPAEGSAGTIYTRYPTRDLTPPGGLPMPTYVYQPVVTPVSGSEPVF
jgi:anti-sigma factor RsiW